MQNQKYLILTASLQSLELLWERNPLPHPEQQQRECQNHDLLLEQQYVMLEVNFFGVHT